MGPTDLTPPPRLPARAAALSSVADFAAALSEALGIPLRPDDHLTNDLRLDSLQMYELLIVAEEITGLSLADDQLHAALTVSHLYDAVLTVAGSRCRSNLSRLGRPASAI